jgi:hypothetical protein
LKPEEADFDFMIGPRIFANTGEMVKMFLDKYEFTNPKAIKSQEQIRPDSWSNFTFFPVALALYRGKKVRSMDAEYRHPHKQTVQEANQEPFEEKRNAQRIGILSGMVYFLDQLGAGVPKGRIEGTTGRLRK